MAFIIANWKMNPQKASEAKALFEAVSSAAKRLNNIEVAVCPPFCFLPFLKPKKNILTGGQDLFWELQGAYTGEISGKMLKDLECDYVIIGHSERRLNAGETNEIINAKLQAALKSDLKPILCVGEKQGEELGPVIAGQLEAGLKNISKNQLRDIAIAYEPIWAISSGLGTGNPCKPDEALSAALFIRKILTNLYGRYLAEKIKIAYGGSVDASNVGSYLQNNQIGGLLVGGASLDADEFRKLLEKVNDLQI
ncbi:MAG: triose-phosphate isomerase [Candidatus Portnoybacteria bacterium]|nr:triose-phosphate isomerase [Candidatus Portnoybacteria bacterium]